MAEIELLTVEQVAKYLKVSEQTIFSWINKGILPAVKIEKTIRINRTDLDEFIKTRSTLSQKAKNNSTE